VHELGNFIGSGQCEVFKKLHRICLVVEPYQQTIEDYIVAGEVTDDTETSEGLETESREVTSWRVSQNDDGSLRGCANTLHSITEYKATKFHVQLPQSSTVRVELRSIHDPVFTARQ
jgi:hypothetical protein